MLFIAVLIGKLLLLASKTAGRGGSALPGFVIERLNPGFLKRSLDQLPGGVIIVTGTNGKTTTTKLISDLLAAHNLRVLTNRTGSNFVRGIISTVVSHSNWRGKLAYDVAVFEQDEAYAARFVERYKPRGVVALNVSRDQMDRYGEIDKTAELIGQAVAAATDWVVLNSNDQRIANLRSKVKDPKSIHWFGHDAKLHQYFLSDDQHYAGRQAEYFQAKAADFQLAGFSHGSIKLNYKDEPYSFKTALDGAQNALNITAALAALFAEYSEASIDTASTALAAAEPAFGRGEQIVLKNGCRLRLQLVKNPSSFTHSLRFLDDEKYATVGIAINDDYADGRDVSWLWDVDFQKLQKYQARIICGGSRAYDMANRLKYDETHCRQTETASRRFLAQVTDGQGPAIIFCTYTAMLRLRKLLKTQAKEISHEGI